MLPEFFGWHGSSNIQGSQTICCKNPLETGCTLENKLVITAITGEMTFICEKFKHKNATSDTKIKGVGLATPVPNTYF